MEQNMNMYQSNGQQQYNNVGYNYNYQQQPQPMPIYYNYQPVMYNNVPTPQNVNALTDDEMNILKQSKPKENDINLNITQDEFLRSICTHKDKGMDKVFSINDGTSQVFCPICSERWDPEKMTKEEITELVEKLVSQMQNMKWVGDLPTSVVREYCTIIPLIRKFPDLYEYAVSNFEKYSGLNPYYNAAETGVYSQYNSLMNGGYGYYQQPQYYGQQYGNPYQQYQQPQYYNQQPQYMNNGQGQPANPYINPMQVQPTMNSNQYGNPYQQPAPQQYQQQVMYDAFGNPYYPAPMQNQQYGQQQPNQQNAQQQSGPQQYSPVVQNQQNAQQQNQQTETKEEKVNL
jgi:hypothetical protein